MRCSISLHYLVGNICTQKFGSSSIYQKESNQEGKEDILVQSALCPMKMCDLITVNAETQVLSFLTSQTGHSSYRNPSSALS